MVADMNITGVAQTQATSQDTPKQKTETDIASDSFATALENSGQKDSEKDSGVKQNNAQKETSNTNGNSNDKKLDDNPENTTQETPNPLTTKPNKSKAESELVKALKGKTDEVQNIAEIDTEAKDKAKNTESIPKDAKADLPMQVALLQDIGTAGKDVESDAGHIDNKKNIKPKSNVEAHKELQQKSLNDVKKEAQARNLNLQKIEILESGKKSTINPEDLMDSSTLNGNKEKLSLALQDKGQALSTSLAKISDKDSNESKKDALLAELLNRYDANANAKRKAQNEMEKLQFKIGDGDKSMVVERTAIQPKNITESKFRNEVMEQEFLEELHNITGDSELGDIVDVNRAKIMAHVAQQTAKLGNAGDFIQKTYQGWAQQGQFLDPKEIKDSKNVAFEMEVQKPFDAMLSENFKVDSKVKEADVATKTEKKTDDKKKEQIESKQEAGAIHTKQEVSVKNAMAREAIRNFASQFREEILNYKPPITRINLELNPANLGQVSMTVSKRGKDLQVSITSNSNVMTMFVQNAQELRQNLMQIGFNNLDLNFSANDRQGSNSQQNDSREQNGEDVKLQSIEEAEAQTQLGNVPKSLEISLPQYA